MPFSEAEVTNRVEQLTQVPSHFVCPLSLKLFIDPVSTVEGFTYERAEITPWLEQGKLTSPSTNMPLAATNLIPSMAIRAGVISFIEGEFSHGISFPGAVGQCYSFALQLMKEDVVRYQPVVDELAKHMRSLLDTLKRIVSTVPQKLSFYLDEIARRPAQILFNKHSHIVISKEKNAVF